MSIESLMLSNHLILCHFLLLLHSIFHSIRVFSNELALCYQVAKGLELQHQSFQWIFRIYFLLGWTDWISLQSKGLSRVLSSNTNWKNQFFGAQPSLWFNSNIHTWLLAKPYFWLYRPLSAKWCLCFLIRCLVNTMSRFVRAFLPRSKRLLILWLQSGDSQKQSVWKFYSVHKYFMNTEEALVTMPGTSDTTENEGDKTLDCTEPVS